ncbi:hypothetical protein GWI33_009234 [Rhynchophorus ferrugineus]|uniref:Small-subunit processome Utp12 domain-containing protein n=1 Tax=Rhynchophorus ferrugineus TaxID=354439 RepID=A0A834IFQ4_RHYFE|nr:hypothetical protein GWI33_009234 [Rhynchophorus ferrugineus]
MKFSYKFSNLLGTVYRKGDLLFTPDGNSVITTVGNRISIFDLKNNKCNTLPIESRFNYVSMDISPNGCTLISINEEGEAHMISLISQTITHRYRFKGKCRAIKFSPDGKHFAVCKENNVFIFKAPGPFSGQYTAFIMERVFHGAYDETTCLNWSSDSKILAVGSKDMATKLYPFDKFGCFFENNSYDLITISKNGQVCVWECTIEPEDLKPLESIPLKKKKTSDDSDEDDIDVSKSLERTEEEAVKALSEVNLSETKEESDKLFYKRIARHYLADEVKKNQKGAVLTATAYHKASKILITGYSTGDFYIHEAPEMNLINSLNISEQSITSISLNQTGDWIALGCSGIGQLLVWEWQSETYLQEVKMENAVTAITFSGNKKFVVSASLDGTVRAFDILRYRNFRTFASPKPVQFSCVGVDTSGEFVAAGGQDVFEIYLWSVKTGRLLEILAGHQGPVASLAFSPSIMNTTMVSASWDKTIKIWDAIEKGSAHETIELVSDAVCVIFNPKGNEVAIATLDGQISIFDVRTAQQLIAIEGRNDLGSGRSDTDLITAKKNLEAKSFTTLCYSADGEYILAGGQSKNVCIYNAKEALLLKKFEITQNRSFDAVDDFINRRKLTEFGNLALVEEREEREGGRVTIKLPGVRKGDMASRVFKPEVRVFSLQFSPTGQQWAAATTEGLLVYTLSDGMIFDPWDLQINITPMAVRRAIEKRDFLEALTMSIKMNEANLIQEVIESIGVKDVELLVMNLPSKYIEKLLMIIATGLENSRHIEYYLYWCQHILTVHGTNINGQKNKPALLSLEKGLIRKYEQLSKICDYNKYTLQYITALGKVMAEKEMKEEKMETDSNSENSFDLTNSDEE